MVYEFLGEISKCTQFEQTWNNLFIITLIDVGFFVSDAYSEKRLTGSSNRGQTYDLLITILGALPLSYRRLM